MKVRYPKVGELWCYEDKKGNFVFAEIIECGYSIDPDWDGESNCSLGAFPQRLKDRQFHQHNGVIVNICWTNYYNEGYLTYIGEI